MHKHESAKNNFTLETQPLVKTEILFRVPIVVDHVRQDGRETDDIVYEQILAVLQMEFVLGKTFAIH